MTQVKARPKIGLALGAGAARGWAHIGVIEALSERNIPIDMISGCSSGAIVAASFATGRLDHLAELARKLTVARVASYFDFSFEGGGLIEGRRVLKFFEQNVEDVALERAQFPLGIVAAELYTGREVWFTEGSLIDAIRASIALPGLLTPIKIDDRWLMDGVLVNPLPVSLCRAMGAERIIAVNLGGDLSGRVASPSHLVAHASESEDDDRSSWLSSLRESLNLGSSKNNGKERDRQTLRPSYVDVLAQSSLIMHNFITRARLAVEPVDVLITPKINDIGFMDFHRAGEAIDCGRAAVESMSDELEHLVDLTEEIN